MFPKPLFERLVHSVTIPRALAVLGASFRAAQAATLFPAALGRLSFGACRPLLCQDQALWAETDDRVVAALRPAPSSVSGPDSRTPAHCRLASRVACATR
jgi:hypothetical protein